MQINPSTHLPAQSKMTTYQTSQPHQQTNPRRSADPDVHAKIDGLMAQAADATIAHFLEWNDYTLHRSHHIVTYNDDKVPKMAGEHNEEWDDDDASSAASSTSGRSVRSDYESPMASSKKRHVLGQYTYPRETRNPYYVPSRKRRALATRAA